MTNLRIRIRIVSSLSTHLCIYVLQISRLTGTCTVIASFVVIRELLPSLQIEVKNPDRFESMFLRSDEFSSRENERLTL